MDFEVTKERMDNAVTHLTEYLMINYPNVFGDEGLANMRATNVLLGFKGMPGASFDSSDSVAFFKE